MMLVRVEAGHQTGTRRGADRSRCVVLVEDHCFRCQRVNVWRAYQRVAVAAQQVAPQLVAKEDEHVRPVCRYSVASHKALRSS